MSTEQTFAQRVAFLEKDMADLKSKWSSYDFEGAAETALNLVPDLLQALREQQAALADLIDACDGNYKELTDECRAVLAKYRIDPLPTVAEMRGILK